LAFPSKMDQSKALLMKWSISLRSHPIKNQDSPIIKIQQESPQMMLIHHRINIS